MYIDGGTKSNNKINGNNNDKFRDIKLNNNNLNNQSVLERITNIST